MSRSSASDGPRRTRGGGHFVVKHAPSGRGAVVYQLDDSGQMCLVATFATYAQAVAWVAPLSGGKGGGHHKPE
jgi:hypothetical protein